jgi:hypothetical protein
MLSCDRPVLAGRAGPQQHVQGALRRGDQPCGSAFVPTEPDRDRGRFTPGEQTVGRERLWLAGFRFGIAVRYHSRQPAAARVLRTGTAAPFLPRCGQAKTGLCNDPFYQNGPVANMLPADTAGYGWVPLGRRGFARTPFWCGWQDLVSRDGREEGRKKKVGSRSGHGGRRGEGRKDRSLLSRGAP